MKVTHKILKQEFQVSEILIEVTPSKTKGAINVVGQVPAKYCSVCRGSYNEESQICTIPTFTLEDIEETFTLNKKEE